MSNTYEFTKLSEVEALEEVPENANALVEVDGAIKRVPGSGLGGDKGIKTAIIKSSDYDNALAGLQTAASSGATFSCLNMTFEEAHQTMASGEPLQAVFMGAREGCMNIPCTVIFADLLIGTPCLTIDGCGATVILYWTADGLSMEAPTA